MITNSKGEYDTGKQQLLKITDFGLSRKIADNASEEEYSRTSDETIPMISSAIETLRDVKNNPKYR